MRSGPECLCLLWFVKLPVYPIVFRHPGLPVGGKHSGFNFIHRHVRSFLLVLLIWHPACEEEGPGEKKRLQYFEFGLQYLVQPLGVNPTYSTFKYGYFSYKNASLPFRRPKMSWGWVNHGVIFLFGWTIPLSTVDGPFTKKKREREREIQSSGIKKEKSLEHFFKGDFFFLLDKMWCSDIKYSRRWCEGQTHPFRTFTWKINRKAEQWNAESSVCVNRL